ncbi:MAG TPA: ABC transporter substrate-binding protein [Hyphomicrobiaceae bacterium]|jgi:TRAP-type mannitol/chloroaromatic compound transport system substrate-binding protein|nr:ABC transporter substrate-binding protein [Hyphomicrobiaceae bacterium]
MPRITRRTLLKSAGAGGAAIAIAAPAVAQSFPTLKWRMATSWPKSLDTLYGGAERFAEYVADATDNKFRIECFPAGAIQGVPVLQVTEAVSAGTVELCHTAPYYMAVKDPTFALACAVPFGLNGRMQNAWWREGGGEELINTFYQKHNIFGLLAGNTMAQMGGWFRREITTADDLKGLRMRIGGFAGDVMKKLGVVPQQLPGGEIQAAFEKGAIDAAEWVGPYDDEKLGLHKAARYYYYPGWWEGGAMLHVQVNKERWEALPPVYRSILAAAATEAGAFIVARYDAQNPQALKRLVGAGTQLRPFSEATMDVCFRAANEVYAEISGKNESFKKIWDSIKSYRVDQYLWLQVADSSYDNYMIVQQRKHTL